MLCAAAAITACTDASPGDGADAGGGDTGTFVAVVDDAGRDVILPAPARRVISMIPAQTEIIGVLAGTDVLVARTQWDTDPSLQHLPSVGNALNPSVEWLAAQRPDLIIVWPDGQSRDIVRRLTDIGIPVYASRVESVDEIRRMIRRLGTLLGTEARADSLVASLDGELEAVRQAVAGRAEPGVLYLLSVEPPMAAGPGSFVDDLITLAGGHNIFADAAQAWPTVSLEEIVRRQPDIIIRPGMRALEDPLAGIAGRPGWRDLAAVGSGRIHGVDPDLFNRAGITVTQTARELARYFHGAAVLAERP